MLFPKLFTEIKKFMKYKYEIKQRRKGKAEIKILKNKTRES